MHLVGSGKGKADPGAVARELLPKLALLAALHHVDIALVENDPAKVAAVQFVRQQNQDQWWSETLTDAQRTAAKDLGAKALKNKLVLFLGAGVSEAAGLPGWNGLLRDLWNKFAKPHEHLSFNEIPQTANPLDVAEVIRQNIEQGRTNLEAEVRKLLEHHAQGSSLAHALLAYIAFTEAVTTDYDRLFEDAIEGRNASLTTLPWGDASAAERWLLKLHGCVSHEGSIVLTRDDYMGYRKEREALAGIVQAMLMTKHMLFVGFSLNDPNFHQIVHDVRRATGRGSDGKEKMGTNLPLIDSNFSRRLWERDFDLTPDASGRNVGGNRSGKTPGCSPARDLPRPSGVRG